MKPERPTVGMTYGRLRVTETGIRLDRKRACRVICECGTERVYHESELAHRRRTTCGCGVAARREAFAALRRQAAKRKADGRKTPTFETYRAMITRCENRRQARFNQYGGRGVTVCPRWRQSFEAFLADMGERPDGMTIDRIDNDRGYEPGNCRWATASEQTRNQRRTKLTPDLVREIVVGAYSAMKQKDVAALLGIAQTTVSEVRRGESWSDVVAAARAESSAA